MCLALVHSIGEDNKRSGACVCADKDKKGACACVAKVVVKRSPQSCFNCPCSGADSGVCACRQKRSCACVDGEGSPMLVKVESVFVRDDNARQLGTTTTNARV